MISKQDKEIQQQFKDTEAEKRNFANKDQSADLSLANASDSEDEQTSSNQKGINYNRNNICNLSMFAPNKIVGSVRSAHDKILEKYYNHNFISL